MTTNEWITSLRERITELIREQIEHTFRYEAINGAIEGHVRNAITDAVDGWVATNKALSSNITKERARHASELAKLAKDVEDYQGIARVSRQTEEVSRVLHVQEVKRDRERHAVELALERANWQAWASQEKINEAARTKEAVAAAYEQAAKIACGHLGRECFTARLIREHAATKPKEKIYTNCGHNDLGCVPGDCLCGWKEMTQASDPPPAEVWHVPTRWLTINPVHDFRFQVAWRQP